jgi:hypothetical protein
MLLNVAFGMFDPNLYAAFSVTRRGLMLITPGGFPGPRPGMPGFSSAHARAE